MILYMNLDFYQNELWVIPANFDDGRTSVPPHVLHSSGPGCLGLKKFFWSWTLIIMFLILILFDSIMIYCDIWLLTQLTWFSWPTSNVTALNSCSDKIIKNILKKRLTDAVCKTQNLKQDNSANQIKCYSLTVSHSKAQTNTPNTFVQHNPADIVCEYSEYKCKFPPLPDLCSSESCDRQTGAVKLIVRSNQHS